MSLFQRIFNKKKENPPPKPPPVSVKPTEQEEKKDHNPGMPPFANIDLTSWELVESQTLNATSKDSETNAFAKGTISLDKSTLFIEILDKEFSFPFSWYFHSTKQEDIPEVFKEFFSLGPIESVQFHARTIEFSKKMMASNMDWKDFAQGAVKKLKEHNTLDFLGDWAPETITPKEMDEVVGKEDTVTEIFNLHVNPALQGHGGQVELVNIDHNAIFIKLSGGCQGCSSAGATLQFGIADTLRKHLPAVGAVIDLTEHELGTNPFLT